MRCTAKPYQFLIICIGKQLFVVNIVILKRLMKSQWQKSSLKKWKISRHRSRITSLYIEAALDSSFHHAWGHRKHFKKKENKMYWKKKENQMYWSDMKNVNLILAKAYPSGGISSVRCVAEICLAGVLSLLCHWHALCHGQLLSIMAFQSWNERGGICLWAWILEHCGSFVCQLLFPWWGFW